MSGSFHALGQEPLVPAIGGGLALPLREDALSSGMTMAGWAA